MLRELAAPLAAAARESLNKGLTALVWALVALGLGITGSGLLLATAVMALSRLTGPVAACGLIGLGLVLLAWAVTIQRRAPPTPVPAPSAPTTTPDHLAFALGFVLARLILSKGR